MPSLWEDFGTQKLDNATDGNTWPPFSIFFVISTILFLQMVGCCLHSFSCFANRINICFLLWCAFTRLVLSPLMMRYLFSRSFKIHSLSILTFCNSSFKSFTVLRSSDWLSFLLSLRFTHMLSPVMIPYSLGKDSPSSWIMRN